MTAEPTNVTEERQTAPPAPRPGIGWFAITVALAAAVALGIFIYSGIQSRVAADSSLKAVTEQNAALFVNVIHPKRSTPTQEVVLPGSIQAFTDSPIYARTNGYLKSWRYDIGAHVKQGDLLAEIEAPEVDKQLNQVKADLQTAAASLELAKSSAERWKALLKLDSVSKQETDEKLADLSVKQATYDSIASNVSRLQDVQSFQKVYAPFDGVITARHTDLGVLINAGANGAGTELFRLAAIHKLRVFVDVPQTFSRASRPGVTARLTLAEFPGRIFTGKLVRTASSLDQASRTLRTEIEVDNNRGELLPGSYVSVHLPLPEQVQTLTIPVNTMLFRSEGPAVAVMRDDKAVLAPITIGRDFGNEVEILSGLNTSDSIILDPPDSLISGTKVRLASGNKQTESGGE